MNKLEQSIDKHINSIVEKVGSQFQTFGGGKKNALGSPITATLENKPPMFAMGVDVKDVVSFVVLEWSKVLNTELAKMISEHREHTIPCGNVLCPTCQA